MRIIMTSSLRKLIMTTCASRDRQDRPMIRNRRVLSLGAGHIFQHIGIMTREKA